MVELSKVKSEQRELLWSILQKYLYEMTNYYNDKMNEAGNYRYDYFDAYFTKPERTALFIYDNQTLAGFAMINPYSYINETPDYVLAEFSIFPMYRKRHIATKAVKIIFRQYTGRWEIKYNEKNSAAKKLWNTVTADYCPKKNKLNDMETVLSFCTDC